MSDKHRPEKIHKTLIWGGWYGSRNIGDTAILLGIKELYKSINFDRHYYLGYLSTDPDYTNTNGATGERALLKSDLLKPWNYFKVLSIFNSADRVIISGGTPIFDFSHKIRSMYMFLPILMRKQFMLFGAGVKPINSTYGKWYIPKVLNKASYVSTRDTGSTKILKGLGVDQPVMTADSAFFAKPSNMEDLLLLLGRHNIKESEKLLVVAPRLMSADKKRLYLDEDMGSDVISEVPKKMAESIDKVAGKFDKIVFMAMHYYGPDSDVELIKETLSYVKTKKAIFMNEELRPDVAIKLFEHSRVVLAMRKHALLLSASMATPIVGVSYEQKVTDLFERLEIKNNVLDMFNFTADQLTATLETTIKQRDEQHKTLLKTVSKLRQLVTNDAKKILRIDEEFSDK
jgi:polysaccharide pyruvyl transferase WcaK-like protein